MKNIGIFPHTALYQLKYDKYFKNYDIVEIIKENRFSKCLKIKFNNGEIKKVPKGSVKKISEIDLILLGILK